MRQGVQPGAAGVGAQVDLRRQLAPAGVGNGGDVGQVRAVDQQHVGPVGGQAAPGHRAGEDAGEVGHAQAGEGLAAGVCPGGEIQRVDDNYANLDTRTVRGHDIAVYYDIDTAVGNFDMRLVGAWLDRYEQKAGGSAAQLLAAKAAGTLPNTVAIVGFSDLVRQDGNPETKQTLRLSWRKDNWGAALTGIRYGDFVQTDLTLADGTQYVIPSMSTFNLTADYRFTAFADIKTRIKIGANNVTNERAPLADDSFGYFADQHSDLGRYYYVDASFTL